jgi:hypothetical protein
LTKRIDDRRLPDIDVVDLRIEAAKQRTLPALSGRLVRAMQDRFEKREQTISSSIGAATRRRCSAPSVVTSKSARIARSR